MCNQLIKLRIFFFLDLAALAQPCRASILRTCKRFTVKVVKKKSFLMINNLNLPDEYVVPLATNQPPNQTKRILLNRPSAERLNPLLNLFRHRANRL